MNKIEDQKTNYGALTMLTTVFFFWGFIAAGNSVFIPFCRNYFALDQFQGQLVDFAFYGAYYLGALALFAWGSGKGKDIVMSWGYKTVYSTTQIDTVTSGGFITQRNHERICRCLLQ